MTTVEGTIQNAMNRKIDDAFERNALRVGRQKVTAGLLRWLVRVGALLTVAVLLFIIGFILINGIPYITPSLFEWEYTSENVSLMPALINTLFMTGLSLLFAVPVGIGAAIYLSEYAKKSNKFVYVVRTTTEVLAGIPSIIYGLFGLLFFVTALQWGMSLLAGAATLAIMILPTIMRTTEESLHAVPLSYREGSFSLGAGKLTTIFKIILPSAAPGILGGIILSIGRAVGEVAALIYTAGTIAAVPNISGEAFGAVFDSTRTLAVHMYVLASEGLHINETYATAVILLVLVASINFLSTTIANRMKRG